MKDILRIQFQGVDNQQLLFIWGICNCHFMKVFSLYGDQAQNISVLI